VSGVSGAGPVNFTASLSSISNNYLLTSSSFAAISSLVAGITAPTQASQAAGGTNNGTFTLFTNGTVADALATIRVGESGVNSFRGTAQYVDGAVANGSQVRLTFSGLPAGVSLTIGAGSKSSSLTTPTFSRTSITTANNTSLVSFANTTTGTDLTATESFAVEVTAVTVVAGTTPAAGTITMTASLGPVSSTGLDTTVTPNVPTNTDGYPRFAAIELGPVTIGQIIAANTQLLVPYVIKLGTYDTGIALANTTADPFGGVTNGGAAAGSGVITVSFYPVNSTGGAGTSFSLTTSPTIKPGAGLSSDGTLASGATWTVLASDLLTAAGKTGDFAGYVFISANFLNAHGTATISDFRSYSLAASVLVLPPPGVTARSTGGFEALNN
jgi:hypothetical protein